jgi:hypothetical protein
MKTCTYHHITDDLEGDICGLKGEMLKKEILTFKFLIKIYFRSSMQSAPKVKQMGFLVKNGRIMRIYIYQSETKVLILLLHDLVLRNVQTKMLRSGEEPANLSYT